MTRSHKGTGKRPSILHICLVVSSLPMTPNYCSMSKADPPPEHSLLEPPPRTSQTPLLSILYTNNPAPTCATHSQGRETTVNTAHMPCCVFPPLDSELLQQVQSGSLLEPASDKPNSVIVYIIPTRAILHLIAHTSTTRSQLTEKQRSHKSTLYLSIIGDHSRPLSEPTLHFTGVYCFRAPSTTEHDCIAYMLLLLPQVRLLRQHSSNQDRAHPYYSLHGYQFIYLSCLC
jgi:hypothetical protein